MLVVGTIALDGDRRSESKQLDYCSLSMWMNNKPMITGGISQQTTGIKIQGR
jgi:hypothetical protein